MFFFEIIYFTYHANNQKLILSIIKIIEKIHELFTKYRDKEPAHFHETHLDKQQK